MALAVCCGAMVAWSAAAGGQSRSAAPRRDRSCWPAGGCSSPRAAPPATARTCAGARRWARPLRGAGAAAADFYLSTGRMPLADPTDEPERTRPAYPRADIEALVAFVGSFGGPGIPRVDPAPRGARHGHGEVHRALRRLPPDRRARGHRHRRRRPRPRRHDADPARRGRPRRALPDAEVLRAAARPADAGRDRALRAVDPPSRRPRRLGHRQPRPGARGDGHLVPGHGRPARASRG